MLNENIIRDYEISIHMSDLNKTINSKAIFNKQDIKTSVLVVNILDDKVNRRPVNLENTSVIAKILKNDNTTSTIMCSILDPINGKIAIGFSEQSIVAVGDNKFELVLQSNDQVSYSPKIVYKVVDNLFDETDEILSQNEFPILVSLIQSVHALESDVNDLNLLISNNEEIRHRNETLRDTAEKVRTSNEDVRIKEFNNIKTEIQNKINTVNNQLQLITTALNNVDVKINEVDVSIGRINTSLTELNKWVSDKTLYINVEVKKMNDAVDSKLLSVDKTVNSLISTVNMTVDNKIKEFTTIINNIKMEFNKLLDSNNEYVEMLLTVVSSGKEEIDKVNETDRNINMAEEVRKANEIKRQQTFDNMVNSMNFTQTDIDDIVNMVGDING